MKAQVYEIGGDLYAGEVVDNGHVRFYRHTGHTRNVRVLAMADAAITRPDRPVIQTVHVHKGEVLLQHWNAGIEERLSPRAWLDPPVATFEQVDPVGGFPDG